DALYRGALARQRNRVLAEDALDGGRGVRGRAPRDGARRARQFLDAGQVRRFQRRHGGGGGVLAFARRLEGGGDLVLRQRFKEERFLVRLGFDVSHTRRPEHTPRL